VELAVDIDQAAGSRTLNLKSLYSREAEQGQKNRSRLLRVLEIFVPSLLVLNLELTLNINPEVWNHLNPI
jgi:hypothetical protein